MGENSELARARDGDDTAFTRLVAPLRRELHAHCYRMLGSTHDADDALQDALVRAWRGLARFEGRSTLRTWLYTVATRTCLDLAEARGRRALPMDLGPASERAVLEGNDAVTDVAWLGPYPDGPDADYERREAVELAFVVALQHLPGNLRAALLLFDVLGFSAAEIAAMMDTSVTSVNSALARARQTVERKAPAPAERTSDTRLRELAAGYAAAMERGDTEAFVALLTDDVTWSMPPMRYWYQGIEAVTDFAVQVPLTRCPSWQHRIISANNAPAVASYLGASRAARHDAWSITVLSARDGRIAGLTSFIGGEHFPAFGLPAALEPIA